MMSKMMLNHGTAHTIQLSSRNWINWYPETSPLLAAYQVTLQPGVALGMYHGTLQIPGIYQGYTGYRLPDGKIVYNGLEPVGVMAR